VKPKAKQTPAQLARQRRDPAVGLPPQPPKTERDLDNLNLRLPQGNYLLGPRLLPQGAREDTMEGASQVTLTANDPDGAIVKLLGSDAQRLSDGVRVELDGISYVLSGVQASEDLSLSMTFEDEVAWRLRRYSKYLSKDRASTTRAEFVKLMVDEASRPPSLPMRAFIPELTDKQPVLTPKGSAPASSGSDLLPAKRTSTSKSPAALVKAGQPARAQGTGVVSIKVKRKPAKALQIKVINDALNAAKALGASRRVMIAVVMCVTQESNAGLDAGTTGNDDAGYFQQGREWISLANTKDAGAGAKAFLLGPDANVGGTGGTKGWKQRHGSVKSAPGDLEAAIKAVQISVGGYGQWEAEATATVDAYLGGSAVFSSSTTAGSGSTVPVPFLFERGTRDGSEHKNSWDTIGDLASEVRFRRWAALNTLYFVSDDELIAAAPSLQITGDEPWLLAPPAWEWGTARNNATLTVRVLSERWGVLPGAVVFVSGQGAIDGRYLVLSVRDDLYSPESEITLTRPIEKAAEPPQEAKTVDGTINVGGTLGATSTGAIVARAIPGSPVPGIPPHAPTHPTGGLSGYPAYDYLAPAGTPCVAPVSGTIFKLSGKDPSLGGPPGGALGYSIYLEGGGRKYFMTHLDKVLVHVGQSVRQGEQIAQIAAGPASWSTPHVHMGVMG
jgi:murein DD-endopeptidase MepM/ murein hydrolase activator NlpD